MNYKISEPRRIKFLNSILLFTCLGLAIWIISIWITPSHEFKNISSQKIKKTVIEEKEKTEITLSSYDVIVEKDLFRKSRHKFVPKPAPSPVKVLPPPPEPQPKRPPPRLALIGTIILDDGNKAIIEYGGRRNYYGIGEHIEDFVIQEIDMNYVLLGREGEMLKLNVIPVQ